MRFLSTTPTGSRPFWATWVTDGRLPRIATSTIWDSTMAGVQWQPSSAICWLPGPGHRTDRARSRRLYLDPDYAGQDTTRYPWLAGTQEGVDARQNVLPVRF